MAPKKPIGGVKLEEMGVHLGISPVIDCDNIQVDSACQRGA
jgi:hypothetical protein